MTPAPTREAPYRRGVGMMLLNADGLVFVARRAGMNDRHWQMPQGGIDAGENPRQAALRELEEEIGTNRAEIVAEAPGWIDYDLPAEVARQAWGGAYRGQTHKWFVLRFTGRDRDIDLATDHQEFDAWKWVAMETLPMLVVPFKRAAYALVVASFRHLVAPEATRD
jgi:putative (di)nucleoside polyphosphate hydrolase